MTGRVIPLAVDDDGVRIPDDPDGLLTDDVLEAIGDNFAAAFNAGALRLHIRVVHAAPFDEVTARQARVEARVTLRGPNVPPVMIYDQNEDPDGELPPWPEEAL